MKYAAALLVTFSLLSGAFFTDVNESVHASNVTPGNGDREILDLPYEV